MRQPYNWKPKNLFYELSKCLVRLAAFEEILVYTMSGKKHYLITILISVIALIPRLSAQVPLAANPASFSFLEENDFFALSDASDIHYTQGLRIECMRQLQTKPRFFGLIPLPFYDTISYGFNSGFVLAQNLYTPQIIDSVSVQPNDRPFAAWLYGGSKIQVVDMYSNWQDTYEFTVGLLGPAALGDPMQSGVHSVLGDPNPTWVAEIKPGFPVAFFFSFDRRWILDLQVCSTCGIFSAYIVPHAGFRLGNVFTDLNAGTTLFFGINAPRNFDVGRINPSVIGAPTVNFRLYFSAQAAGRLGAFNFSMDHKFGNNFEVERKPLVGDIIFGAHLEVWRIMLSFLQVFRTPELKGVTENHDYGVMQVSWTI